MGKKISSGNLISYTNNNQINYNNSFYNNNNNSLCNSLIHNECDLTCIANGNIFSFKSFQNIKYFFFNKYSKIKLLTESEGFEIIK